MTGHFTRLYPRFTRFASVHTVAPSECCWGSRWVRWFRLHQTLSTCQICSNTSILTNSMLWKDPVTSLASSKLLRCCRKRWWGASRRCWTTGWKICSGFHQHVEALAPRFERWCAWGTAMELGLARHSCYWWGRSPRHPPRYHLHHLWPRNSSWGSTYWRKSLLYGHSKCVYCFHYASRVHSDLAWPVESSQSTADQSRSTKKCHFTQKNN